jgi:tetratricopeptide (TPR) repeat protein
MTAIAPPDRRWVFGPVPDLLLGCGLGYALLIASLPLLPIDNATLGVVGTFGTLLIAAPHYGATLLRVYRHRADRRKYAFFSVYLSAVVWLWFVAGLHDLRVGSAMITLYLTWSPWHYTGQNYGLAVMFLRRRGIGFSERTKKLLYASFMASFALAFLSIHRGTGNVSYGVGDFAGTPFYLMHLDISPDAWWALFGVTLVAYGGLSLATFAALLRTARALDLLPVAALVLAQGLWFTLPNAWAWWTDTLLRQQSVSWLFVWAILGHSAQYLWITTYYAVGREGGRRRWGYLLATLGAGSAVWALPALLFSPQLFGTHSYVTGLFLMIAAAVNLQHFILDGAIWKLRDTGVGAILLAKPQVEATLPAEEQSASTWWRPIAWMAGALVTVLSLYGAAEQMRWESTLQASDMDAARASGERLSWIGRADPRFAMVKARLARKAGDLDAEVDAYRESLALQPTAEAWFGLALAYTRRREPDAAEQALHAALALDPGHARAHRQLGLNLLERGRREAGLAHLATAARLRRGDPTVRAELEAAWSASDSREIR